MEPQWWGEVKAMNTDASTTAGAYSSKARGTAEFVPGMHTVQWPRLSGMTAMKEMKAMHTGALTTAEAYSSVKAKGPGHPI